MRKIFAVITLICLIVILSSCGSTTTQESVWPQNGEIIAVIDGVEYKYDPIYLFKLTNNVFSEDGDSIDPILSFSDKEVAVFLELCYLEMAENINITTEEVNAEKELRMKTANSDLLSKCIESEDTTEEEYWHNVNPYIKKALIAYTYSNSLLDNKEDTSSTQKVFQELQDKYNVEMKH